MVWSDPEVQKLCREFVTVTEEVHFIFPEGDWALNRIKDEPAHKFFRQYGESMPEGDWNDPGTKQGVYLMGPNAEYLEGKGALSGGVEETKNRLKAALARWKKLAKKKKYANKPVPRVTNYAPPEAQKKPLAMRVFLRDLPRSSGDQSGRRFEDSDLGAIWPRFMEWAWNVNWITFNNKRDFVTKSKTWCPMNKNIVARICREVLVDNVRGQNGHWQENDLKSSELKMRRIKTAGPLWSIEYQGKASMRSATQAYAPKILGKAVWNAKTKKFVSLSFVAIGQRSGHGHFNQRNRDRGPAPMGIALVLHGDE